MPQFDEAQLTQFATSLLRAGGASEEESQVIGASLVGANLRGYDSHGVMRIPFYLDMLAEGDIVSGVDLAPISETDTVLAADAQWGFGRVQCGRLLDKLMGKAEASGIGVGTLRNCSHIGRLGEYCEIAAEKGLVSQLMVNTHGAARRVAPPGGREPRLGTNPMALGAPHADGDVILDFSTSATAEGKVRVKKIAGETCPEGWLIDSEGEPTTDPEKLYADPPGTILPMGGEQAYKGFGLALMIDIFSGALSGGLCARETPITPKGNCVFVMLCDPRHFGGRDHFAAEVQQLIDFNRSCATIPGVEKITLPGDPERNVASAKRKDGIPLDDGNWQQLTDLAKKLGVRLEH